MSNSIVDLGALAQPATKFVEVVAQGIGRFYEPIGTIRQAKADAKAKLIIAEADVAVTEFQRRAVHRWMYVECERQKNLDAIVGKARDALPDKVNENPVSKDWITHFFDAAQDVSDEDMQQIWARILAGEVAEPGSTSRRTLEFLKTMDKEEAELFLVLLSVSFVSEGGWHFIVEDRVTTKAIRAAARGADIETHFIDIGILGSESSLIDASKTTGSRFTYGTENFKFVGPPSPKKRFLDLSIAFRLFTSIGQELSMVARCNTVNDFIADLSDSLQKEFKVRIEKDTGEQVTPDNEQPMNTN